ncbi:MAG: hypothetical protein MZV64_42315 [Ignavibacteriales bacterium]|nr:hypothetical protein [Ignavibacteriales bacterium]
MTTLRAIRESIRAPFVLLAFSRRLAKTGVVSASIHQGCGRCARPLAQRTAGCRRDGRGVRIEHPGHLQVRLPPSRRRSA